MWLGIAALTLFLRAPGLLVEVLDPDEAGHAVHAFVWMDGGTPYVDFIDNKQPLVYAFYRAVFTLFGRSLVAVHAVTLPWLLLTAWLMARIARKVWPAVKRPEMAAWLFTLASSAYVEKDMLATTTEVLMNLPLVAAFWVLFAWHRQTVSSRAAVAGLLGGVAVLFNLKAAVALPALIAAIWWCSHSRPWAHAAILVASFGVPLGLAAAWFAASGALEPFLFWNVLLNVRYAAAGVPLGQAGLRRGIVYGYPRMLLFIAGTLPLWVGAVAAFRASRRNGRTRGDMAILAVWAIGSLAAACIGGRFYGHYFIQLLPPLVLMACGPLAGLLDTSKRGDARDRRSAWRIAAGAGLLFPVAAWTVAGYVRIAGGQLDALRPPVAEVAREVAQRTRPGDRIFVWGYWPQLYYYARRMPATRFVYAQTLSGYVPGQPASLDPESDTSAYLVAGHWQTFADDMARHPAELIVDTAPGAIHFWEKYPVARYPVLRDLIARRYSRETVVAGVAIYRLSRDGTPR